LTEALEGIVVSHSGPSGWRRGGVGVRNVEVVVAGVRRVGGIGAVGVVVAGPLALEQGVELSGAVRGLQDREADPIELGLTVKKVGAATCASRHDGRPLSWWKDGCSGLEGSVFSVLEKVPGSEGREASCDSVRVVVDLAGGGCLRDQSEHNGHESDESGGDLHVWMLAVIKKGVVLGACLKGSVVTVGVLLYRTRCVWRCGGVCAVAVSQPRKWMWLVKECEECEEVSVSVK